MSIADKLTYLQTTKQLLKTEINKINNVLTDNSTFRSYPQELFNGYLDILNNGTDTLWNNLEKVSASGEEATLENVETAPMKIELSGNTSQETTSGKNLFDQTTNQLLNVSRVTWGTNIPQIVDLLNSLNEGQYALSYKVKFDSLDSQISGERNIGFLIINSVSGNINTRRNETVRINEIYNVEGIITITASNKGSFTNCYIYSRSGTGGTQDYTTTYDVQLEQGSPTSYEPYTGGQPSPSPDYPQQVKVVTGENVVSVQGKNLFDVSTSVNGYININTGEIGGSTVTKTSDFIEANSNNTYSFSFDYDTISNTSNRTIAYYNSNKEIIGYAAYIVTNKERTFETPNNTSYVRISYPTESYDIQLEEGIAKTDFVPYSKTDYPINLGDIELCKINTYKDYFHKDSGKWYVHKEIGKYEVLSENIVDVQDVFTNVKYFDFPKPTDDIARGNYKAVDIYYTCAKLASLYPFDTPQAINKILSAAAKNFYRVGFEKGTTLAQAQEKLNGSVLYYVLATPTEEEITNTTLIEQLEAISKAKSVKDKTYITQTNEELPFILDVEAIKEYEVN